MYLTHAPDATIEMVSFRRKLRVFQKTYLFPSMGHDQCFYIVSLETSIARVGESNWVYITGADHTETECNC